MIDRPFPITQEGYDKLKAELEVLRSAGRADIAEKIKYAREFGDISENAEYEQAKNEQGMLEGRILTLETMVKNAVITTEKNKKGVGIGSVVEVEDDFGPATYNIVGPTEADLASGKISINSPVGKALLDKVVGDKVTVKTPGGEINLTIKKLH